MEYVKKTMMGYKEVQGGVYDPECSHIILSKKEYEHLLSEKSRAELLSRDIKTKAEQAIQKTQAQAKSRIQSIETNARERETALEDELSDAQEEIAYQRELNANLLRLARERANADRKLRPKKEHSGFVVMMTGDKEHRYRDSNKHWKVVILQETILQTPYSVDFTEEQARHQIQEDLFCLDDEGRYFIEKIGIDQNYPSGYAEMIKDINWNEVYQQYNVMLERYLRANFKAGYWELIFKHTKPLGIIPHDMRPS